MLVLWSAKTMTDGELKRRLYDKLVKVREGAQDLDNRVVYSFFQRLSYCNDEVLDLAKKEWRSMKPKDWAWKWLGER